MEPSRFDDLTKALATATSRRQALKTIAVTTIGSILGLSGIGTAFAKPKCHRNGLGCGKKDSKCCSGFCDPTTGTCACPPGTTELNGICCATADVCGSVCLAAPCNTSCATCQSSTGTCVCPAGTVQTANGTCAIPCPGGGSQCPSGRCISTNEGNFCSTDNGFGGCNNNNLDCPAGSLCSGAICEHAC